LNILTRRFWGARNDPAQVYWYGGKAEDNFGLKRYDQAIELAHKTIAINSNYVPGAHMFLVAALALTGHDAEAREALQRYLALSSTGPLKTIAAWKAQRRRSSSVGSRAQFHSSGHPLADRAVSRLPRNWQFLSRTARV
jgi:hypothetical protein